MLHDCITKLGAKNIKHNNALFVSGVPQNVPLRLFTWRRKQIRFLQHRALFPSPRRWSSAETSPCGIFGGQSNTETDFPRSNSVFPSQYYSTNVHTHSSFICQRRHKIL